MVWDGSYIIVRCGIIWYGNATMLQDVGFIIWQYAGVMVWQKAGAIIWQNAGNIMIS